MRSERVLGLPVIHIDLGKRCGVVQELILDPKARRVAGLLVKTAGLWRKGLLPIERVYALGREAVTIDDEAAIQDPREETPLRTLWQRHLVLEGMPVLTVGGRGLGTITAYEFGEAGVIEAVHLQSAARGRRGRTSLPGRLVRSFGEDAVIVSDEAEGWLASATETAAPEGFPEADSLAAGAAQQHGLGARLLTHIRTWTRRGGEEEAERLRHDPPRRGEEAARRAETD